MLAASSVCSRAKRSTSARMRSISPRTCTTAEFATWCRSCARLRAESACSRRSRSATSAAACSLATRVASSSVVRVTTARPDATRHPEDANRSPSSVTIVRSGFASATSMPDSQSLAMNARANSASRTRDTCAGACSSRVHHVAQRAGSLGRTGLRHVNVAHGQDQSGASLTTQRTESRARRVRAVDDHGADRGSRRGLHGSFASRVHLNEIEERAKDSLQTAENRPTALAREFLQGSGQCLGARLGSRSAISPLAKRLVGLATLALRLFFVASGFIEKLRRVVETAQSVREPSWARRREALSALRRFPASSSRARARRSPS